jgi:hypothetical protein
MLVVTDRSDAGTHARAAYPVTTERRLVAFQFRSGLASRQGTTGGLVADGFVSAQSSSDEATRVITTSALPSPAPLTASAPSRISSVLAKLAGATPLARRVKAIAEAHKELEHAATT